MDIPHYVGGIGRRTERMKRKHEIEKLEQMAEGLRVELDARRREIEEDPLATSPLFVKELIDMTIPPKLGEEFSTIIHLDGLRVKLEPGEEDKVRQIEIGKRKLSDICEMKKSLYEGYLLKILPEAVTGSVF